MGELTRVLFKKYEPILRYRSDISSGIMFTVYVPQKSDFKEGLVGLYYNKMTKEQVKDTKNIMISNTMEIEDDNVDYFQYYLSKNNFKLTPLSLNII